MHPVAPRTLAPLVLLAAILWLACLGSARAGYISTTFLDDDASISAATSADLAAPALDQGLVSAPAARPATPLFVPTEAPSSIPGGQAAPNAPESSASPQPSAPNAPRIDASAVAVGLFLSDVQRRPPPFPSRLFRPPRHA